MSPRRTLTWAAVFALAFGYLEGAVVVYLRRLVYPDGFRFPLVALDPELVRIEIAREAATILMLLGAAALASADRVRRFGVFAFCFGLWDLGYYAALKLLLDWPASLLDWDVLFLIPLPWLSPVLAPVLVSLALIGAGAALAGQPEGRDWSFLRPRDWWIETAAGLVIIASFLGSLPAVRDGAVPTSYPWWLFLVGWLGGLGWFAHRWRHR